jgi:hypothetical protein
VIVFGQPHEVTPSNNLSLSLVTESISESTVSISTETLPTLSITITNTHSTITLPATTITLESLLGSGAGNYQGTGGWTSGDGLDHGQVDDTGSVLFTIDAHGSVNGSGGGHFRFEYLQTRGWDSGGCTTIAESDYTFPISGVFLEDVANVTFEPMSEPNPHVVTQTTTCDGVQNGQPVHSVDQGPFFNPGPLLPYNFASAVSVHLMVGATVQRDASISANGDLFSVTEKLTITQAELQKTTSTQTLGSSTLSSSSVTTSSSSTTIPCGASTGTNSTTTEICTISSTSSSGAGHAVTFDPQEYVGSATVLALIGAIGYLVRRRDLA